MKKPIAFILVITILLSALCIPAVAATSSAAPPTVATAKDILPAYTGTNSGITYTDTYNDCILMTVTGTTQTAYTAFLDAFESDGSYTKVLRGHKPLEMTGDSANITATAATPARNTILKANLSTESGMVKALHALKAVMFACFGGAGTRSTPLLPL